MSINNLIGTVLVTSSMVCMSAQAAVVSTNAGFSVIEDFEAFDGLVSKGPQLLTAGAVVTSDVFSTIGAFAVDLVDNGTWGAGNNFAGIGDLSAIPTTNEGFVGSMTFDLGVARNGVGADFSIYNDGVVAGEITIEALGVGGVVLETTIFAVDFNDAFASNAALFRGFARSTADIVALRVSGDGFVVDNLSAVPVPAALPMLLGGVAVIGAWMRRGQRRTASCARAMGRRGLFCDRWRIGAGNRDRRHVAVSGLRRPARDPAVRVVCAWR